MVGHPRLPPTGVWWHPHRRRLFGGTAERNRSFPPVPAPYAAPDFCNACDIWTKGRTDEHSNAPTGGRKVLPARGGSSRRRGFELNVANAGAAMPSLQQLAVQSGEMPGFTPSNDAQSAANMSQWVKAEGLSRGDASQLRKAGLIAGLQEGLPSTSDRPERTEGLACGSPRLRRARSPTTPTSTRPTRTPKRRSNISTLESPGHGHSRPPVHRPRLPTRTLRLGDAWCGSVTWCPAVMRAHRQLHRLWLWRPRQSRPTTEGACKKTARRPAAACRHTRELGQILTLPDYG
jgi:hypothetical protein